MGTTNLGERAPNDTERLQRSGYVGLYAEEAAALAAIDRAASSCVTEPEAERWQTSALIDEVDLVKCGYVGAFPSQLTVAATVAPEAYGRVVAARAIESADLEHRKKHLAPAACLNVYPMLGRRPPSRDAAVTLLATVYRHEQQGFDGLLRLWEFKVREFVFVGGREFVKERLRAVSRAALELAQRLGLDASLAPASDHFFPTLENRIKREMQLQNGMKHELVARVGERDVAIASFNFHDTHFSRPYEFDASNTIVTGCVGFGLQRWLAACTAMGTLGALRAWLTNEHGRSGSCP